MSGAEIFLRALTRLDGPFMVERSVKISGADVAAGRMLVSVPRRALLPGAKRNFQAICDDLGAPDISALLPYLSAATDVHFGFEPGDVPVYKAYLEFGAQMPVAHVRFLAVKWRGPAARVNLYFDRTEMPLAARLNLAQEVIPKGALRDQFKELLRHVMAASPLSDVPLLLVEEADTPRRSLDLNLADLEWRGADLAELLPNIPADLVDQRIGHVAAGAGRDGVAFVTLYYGAQMQASLI